MEKTLNPPERILMGPGPSEVSARVLRAMSAPLVGHLDPYFLGIMDENQALLRYVFNTKNKFTIPISGTGSAGMEAALCNVLERGDEIIIGINGLFSMRMKDIAERCGAKVRVIEQPLGRIFEPEEVKDALKKTKPKAVALVHAETSTGAWQPLKEIGGIVREHEALFIIDAVTSLGGIPVDVDANFIDICYSCTQKCLGCPPGLSPITLNERALEVIANRRTKVQSWYLDLSLLRSYWGKGRTYHHTAPISMNYALNEGLKIIKEEGLENRYDRHKRVSNLLKEGLVEMGFGFFAQEGHRLPMLTTVTMPEGVEADKARLELLQRYNIEFGGGFGELKDKIWRIGLMGHTASEKNVYYALNAIKNVISKG